MRKSFQGLVAVVESTLKEAPLALATGRSKTFYARKASLEHLDDLEDLYLAEQRLMGILVGRSKTTSFE
jgi:RHH-type rel operon transcriptional repressor/antitoxin RelB